MNRQPRPARRAVRTAAGFTLPEVLATMVLVAIIVPVAMRGISIGMQGTAESRHKLEAAQLAQNKLNELLVDRLSTGLDGSGDFGDAFPEYRWESVSMAYSAGSTSATLTQLDVSVLWKAQGTDRKVTLSTVVYPIANAIGSETSSAGGQ